MADNMHAKMLVVDGRHVHLTTGNIQYAVEDDLPAAAPERQIPHWEGENGVTVADHPALAEACTAYFRGLCRHRRCERLDVAQATRAGTASWPRYRDQRPDYRYTAESPVRWCGRRLETRIRFDEFARRVRDHVPAWHRAQRVAMTATQPSIGMWARRWPVELDPLLAAVGEARQSLVVMTPNFSDLTLWHHLWDRVRHHGVTLTVVTGWRFNDTRTQPARTLVRGLTALRSNRDMFRDVVRPAWRALDPADRHRLRWFWYGYEGHVFETLAPRCAHHKVFLVDDRTVVTGSINCHVFSVYNCAEIAVRIDSPEAVRDVRQHLVEPRLRQARQQGWE